MNDFQSKFIIRFSINRCAIILAWVGIRLSCRESTLPKGHVQRFPCKSQRSLFLNDVLNEFSFFLESVTESISMIPGIRKHKEHASKSLSVKGNSENSVYKQRYVKLTSLALWSRLDGTDRIARVHHGESKHA